MKVALVAQPNLNIVDGSTIWILNTLRMLDRIPGCRTTYFSQNVIEDRTLADLLPSSIEVVDVTTFRARTGASWCDLTPTGLITALSHWEALFGRFERLLVRGDPYLERMLRSDAFAGRLTGYAADVLPRLGVPNPGWLESAREARMPLIVQSDLARRVLASLCDFPQHLVHAVPPVLVDPPEEPDPRQAGRLVYSGKIDPAYGLSWLLDYVSLGAGPVEILAGKEARRPSEPGFFARFDAVLREPPEGLSIARGLPHDRALATMAAAEFGYCLRDSLYDDTLEISTKAVEFCALGVFPILNDTAVNRDLFGDDYPFFVTPCGPGTAARIDSCIAGATLADRRLARAAISRVARRHDPTRAARALQAALLPPGRASTVCIATHEPKFLREWVETRAADRPAADQPDIQWQEWSAAGARPKPGDLAPVAPDVETVFCEWCCENAVWHSWNKRPGTRLVIRLHRFEAFTGFPSRVNWPAVDRLVVTSGHFRDLAIRDFGVAEDVVRVVPQYVNCAELRRPKHDHARFTLGLVGINPFGQKRLDRALDLVAALRQRESRFRLVVRSDMPWRLGWVWTDDPSSHDRYRGAFLRARRDPRLRGAVRFDPPGVDMAEWYRNIGVILSSSDSEGCHTAVMEGLASGAFPVVADWPGAGSLFGAFVHDDLLDAIPAIVEHAKATDLDQRRAELAAMASPWDLGHFEAKALAA